MALLFYDDFSGSGGLNGRSTASGHAWSSTLRTDGDSNHMSVAGGLLSGVPGLAGSQSTIAERAWTDFAVTYGMSVQIAFTLPTDVDPDFGFPAFNGVLLGLLLPATADSDTPWHPSTDSRNAGFFNVAREIFTDYTEVPAADHSGAVMRFNTPSSSPSSFLNDASILPARDSIGPTAQNILRIEFDAAITGGIRHYVNGTFIRANDSVLASINLAARLAIQVLGAATVDYLVAYPGTGPWDGSPPGSPDEPYNIGWWRNLANCTQEVE